MDKPTPILPLPHYRAVDATCARSFALFGFEECDDCGSERGLDRGYAVLCDECEPFDTTFDNEDNDDDR